MVAFDSKVVTVYVELAGDHASCESPELTSELEEEYTDRTEI